MTSGRPGAASGAVDGAPVDGAPARQGADAARSDGGAGRRVVVLPEVPALSRLYARGVLGTARLARRRAVGAGDLPQVEHVAPLVPVDADRLSAYQRLLGEPGTDVLPPGFLHVLAFPIAVSVLVRPDFPLPLAGLVHVANRVEQRRPVLLGERLDVRTWVHDLRAHAKGAQVAVHAEVTVDRDVVWHGISTYLARGVRLHGGGDPGRRPAEPPATGGAVPASGTAPGAAGGAASTGDRPPDTDGLAPTAVWRLGADTGRRYAEVSGDINPIHLSALTAKAFGFPRAIAHGMYTAARAVAAIGPRRGEAFVWDATFAAPVLLPGTVSLRLEPTSSSGTSGWRYVAWDTRSGRRHLHGAVQPTKS